MGHVSFRLDPVTRGRLKARIGSDSVSLQSFMTGLVTDELSGRRARAALPHAIKTLRSHASVLHAAHVEHLWVFGSVARGEERPESDIDLIAEFDPLSRVSLTAVSRIRLDLSDILGRRVDLAEWRTLRPEIVDDVRHDAVLVF